MREDAVKQLVIKACMPPPEPPPASGVNYQHSALVNAADALRAQRG